MPDTLPPTGYHLPPLPWLRAFEAAARHSSFTAAAEELNLTQAAVSHQVRSLEKHLGVTLFERLPRSLRLTEMGAAYLPPLRRSFGELAAATAGLFGSSSKRTLTIRAPVSFLGLWLARRIGSFIATYPDISIRLVSVVWSHTEPDEATDIDIRFGDGIWPGYTAYMLVQSPAIAVCHPDLVRDMATREGIEALMKRMPLIHVTGYENLWHRFLKPMGINAPNNEGLNSDTSIAAIEYAAEGVGPAAVLACLAESALASGKVVRCLPGTASIEQGHYLLTTEGRRRPNPDAVKFRQWLLDEAARNPLSLPPDGATELV